MASFYRSIIVILILTTLCFGQTRPIEFNDFFEMGRVTEPQISPDGKYVVYTVTVYSIEKNKGNSDIHLVSTEGKEQRQLTFSEKRDHAPQWSPDGESVAFISNRDGSSQIYTIPLSGGEAEKITEITTEVKSFTWSPDGNYFMVATDMHPDAASPAESKKMDEEKEKDPANARIIDGLLYRHWNEWREGKYSRVLVVPVEGGEAVSITPPKDDTPPISLGSDHDFVWAANSSNICYVRNPDPMVAISTNNDL
ncbi:MAG: S9 family peptidase, partial [Phycisphaerae bacterium]|nr:S9 family peptidase [Phycisphaerae bacterium]